MSGLQPQKSGPGGPGRDWALAQANKSHGDPAVRTLALSLEHIWAEPGPDPSAAFRGWGARRRPGWSLPWAALAAHLQQLLGEVPAVLQAIQVVYEFLAAHALPNVLWHGEKWDSWHPPPGGNTRPATLEPSPGPHGPSWPLLGLRSHRRPPHMLTGPCRSVFRSMMAQVKVCTESVPERGVERKCWDRTRLSLCPQWAGTPNWRF